MMGKIINPLGFILFFCVFGCRDSVSQDESVGEKTVELLNKGMADNGIVLNEDGVYLALVELSESRYLARWGKSSASVSEDTIRILPDGNPSVTMLRNKGIYIRQGCGTACFFAYVLSFLKEEAMYYSFPLLIDLEHSLVAYNGEDTASLVVVENYNSKKRQQIKVDFLPGIYPGQSIDSISFESGRSLFIRWEGPEKMQREEKFALSGL